jgi:UDP-3-O-[3-hydroxymyristoyl] glucosamine N-acyltransferase
MYYSVIHLHFFIQMNVKLNNLKLLRKKIIIYNKTFLTNNVKIHLMIFQLYLKLSKINY